MPLRRVSVYCLDVCYSDNHCIWQYTDGYQQHQLLAEVVACYGYTAIGAGNP